VIIYYVIISEYKDIQGCFNRYKLEKLYPGYEINECEFYKFKGYHHNSEWL